MRAELEAVARRQHRAFTIDQARPAYTPGEIRARIASGSWVRLRRGVFAPASAAEGLATRLSALRLAAGRRIVAVGQTAAELHGFAVDSDRLLHVADPRQVLRGTPGVRVHQVRVPPGEVCVAGGAFATVAARTVIDTARGLPRRRALATVDAALRCAAVVREGLLDECLRQAGQRGICAVRELLALADGRAESPRESELRLLCADAGLPAPVPQYEVRGPHGVRRLDLAWPTAMVAAEYDGVEVHTGAALTADRQRINWLVGQGWTVIQVTHDDLRHRPDRIVQLVRLALLRAAA